MCVYPNVHYQTAVSKHVSERKRAQSSLRIVVAARRAKGYMWRLTTAGRPHGNQQTTHTGRTKKKQKFVAISEMGCRPTNAAVEVVVDESVI